MSLIKYYKKIPPLFKLLVNGFFLFILWWLFYTFLRDSQLINLFYEKATAFLTQALLAGSKLFLSIFGIETITFGKTIRILGTGGVYLDRGCLGRNLMGLFAGFILAYPGKIKHKLWYIPAGLIFIQFLNVLRISALAYTVICCPEYIDINHHIIFKYTVYFFIFLMWYFWIQKINKDKLES